MRKLFGLGLVISLLIGCGGEQADIEKARFLLASGQQEAATEAAEILEPLLDSATGELLLEALELYAGAKMAQAGLDPIRLVSRLIHRLEGEKVRTAFRKAIQPAEGGGRFALLLDAQQRLEAVTGNLQNEDPLFGEAGFTAVEAASDYQNASEPWQRRLDLALANVYFIEALFILVDVSGFNQEDIEFTTELCKEEVNTKLEEIGESLDPLTLALYRARWFYHRLGFDDKFFGQFAGDNHVLIDFIEDLQFEFDAGSQNRNDITGLFVDPDVENQIDELCDYLQQEFDQN